MFYSFSVAYAQANNNINAEICSCTLCADLMVNVGRVDKSYAPVIPENAVVVATSKQLISALKKAKNGQTIVIEDGIYDIGWQKIPAQIRLIARNLWGAVLPNSLLDLSGKGTLIQGLRFENGAAVSYKNSRDHAIYIRADDIKIIDNQFENVGVNSSIPDKTGITIELIKADNVSITRNQFSKNKGIAIRMDDYSRKAIVSNNDFLDSPNYGGVGEIVHIGDAFSTEQGVSPVDDETKARIEFNYIRGWDLEPELISIKSDANIIANNFIEKSGQSAIVVRMGNRNRIYNNIIKDNIDFPIRISGEENIIDNNIFSGTGALVFLHNKVVYPKPSKNLIYAYLAARNNKIINNTFIGYNDIFGIRDQYYIVRDAPTGNLFERNIIYTQDIKDFVQRLKSDQYVQFKNNKVFDLSLSSCVFSYEVNR